MTLRTKLEDLRKTPSLAPTAAEYRALLELALAVEAVENADLIGYETPEQRKLHEDMKAALARLAEAMK